MGPEIPQRPWPDAEVARIAHRQQGNVTRGQLLSRGVNDNGIAHRVRTGRLFRVHTGVYAVGRPPRLPLEWASAAVLACGPTALLSHEGALASWGFAGEWPRSFDLIVTAGDPRPKGITVHRCRGLNRADIRFQLGIRTTSPARTLLDCAPRLDARRRTRTIADALHSPYLTRSALADTVKRFPQHAGARLLAAFADGSAPDTRSPLEDDFQTFCRRHGLPRPQTNVVVAGHLVDALFEPQKLIVETDGWEFHRDRFAFEADRERDADTLRAGYATIRITSERLHARPAAEAEAEADRLRSILRDRTPPA